MLRGGQGIGRSGPVRGAPVGGLAPAHHSGHAGAGISGGDQAPSSGARMPGRKRGSPSLDAGLISLTAPEARRLLTRLVWTANQPAGFVLAWCRWTRRRQASTKMPLPTATENAGITSATVVLKGDPGHLDEPKSRRSRKVVAFGPETTAMLKERRAILVESGPVERSQVCARRDGSRMIPDVLS